MKISELKHIYDSSKQVQEIVKEISNPTKQLFLEGIAGSSIGFIGSSVFNFTGKNQLFICNDKETAAYFYNDFQSILGNEKVLFFPEAYKIPYKIEDTENLNVLIRTEVLQKISSAKEPYIIVTYPEALSEKVVSVQTISTKTINLKLNESLSIDFLNELLIEYHFERVDFVTDPGQYTIRGGIVDVFSFANDYPFRIEFFGDEIESIRTFDPENQLSLKQLESVKIIPNLTYTEEKKDRINFLDFIPKETPLWIQQREILIEKINTRFLDAKEKFDALTENVIKLPTPNKIYTSKRLLNELLSQFTCIEFGIKPINKDINTISFHQNPQPLFNKNFELLADRFKKNEAEGISNILLADNIKQIERLRLIFEDLDKAVHFDEVLLSINQGFIDYDLKIACFTDHQIFNRFKRFKLKENEFNSKKQSITLKDLHGLKTGDYVTHIDHGVGRFSGLEKIEINGKVQEAIRLIYANHDMLYVNIHALHKISKYIGNDGHEPKLNKLGTATWQKAKEKTKNRIKEVAFDLIKLYAKRKQSKGFAFSPDNYLQHELEASFIYEDTPDQLKATIDVKKDMEAPHPMDRLVCGDVGFGKTEIAIRAAFKAVCDSKQVAVLVPTTILALQHYKTFKQRLEGLPCTVDYINRFKTTKQQKETLKKLAEGKVDIIIGTHRLIGKDVKFKDLGLLIIDEEQKFGVSVKDKLKTIKVNVDTLTLTATPIPRTLQFSLMAARDLSVINTPPPNRQPVYTELCTFNEEKIRDVIGYELSRNGQVFFIHNRVQNIEEIAGMIQRLCPDARVLIAHGQMKGDVLEKKMMAFVEGEYDVLVATTIIESGLDIPNANTIIINNAHYFGLSDLHQMRGRVGRSNTKAFCYLFAPPLTTLTEEARKRLKAIEQFSDLGSGFQIAMRDLDIRGAGNLLGAEQSGFISEIGFDTYQKILQEAIDELKESEFKELFKEEIKEKEFVKECTLETDLELLIPDNYITNIEERLQIYRDIDQIEEENSLHVFKEQLVDRFGEMPTEVLNLFDAVRLRWIAKEIGFEKLVLKQEKLIGYFISNQESEFFASPKFSKIIQFVQHHSNECVLKERNNKLSLVFSSVNSISAALDYLNKIKNFSLINVS